MRRFRFFLRLIALGVAAYSARMWLTARRPVGSNVTERRAEPDPESLAAMNQGRVGLDLERLKGMQSSAYKPLVEYLTYIQVQRGDERSLVFVRQKDLDSLAAMTGGSREDFVEEFKQLGVLLSMN